MRLKTAFCPGGIPKCQLSSVLNNELTEPQVMTDNSNCFKSKRDQPLLYLNCLLYNARSVVANLSEFQYTLYGCNYDIILVTETWLTTNDTIGLLDPECKYFIFRRDRRCNVGGGVCVIVRRGLTCTEVRCGDTDDVEMLCVDVLFDTSLFRFIVIYRPPQYGNMVHSRHL